MALSKKNKEFLRELQDNPKLKPSVTTETDRPNGEEARKNIERMISKW